MSDVDPAINFPISGDGKLRLVLVYPEGWNALEGSHTTMMMVEQFAAALQTTVAKNRLYADAWREQGWMGNLARIMSKVARLRQMVWRDHETADVSEPVQDTVQDLINLCIFFLLNRQGGNKWGRGDRG